jgi:hypothetical protein
MYDGQGKSGSTRVKEALEISGFTMSGLARYHPSRKHTLQEIRKNL